MQLKVEDNTGVVQYIGIFISDQMDDMAGTREILRMRKALEQKEDESYKSMYENSDAVKFNNTQKIKY